MSAVRPSLPEALQRHALSRPSDPWLFFAVGWRWRWCSFGTVAHWAADWSTVLEELAPGTVVGSPGPLHAAAVVFDLALQRAGLVADSGAPPDLRPSAAPAAAADGWRLLLANGEDRFLPFPETQLLPASRPDPPPVPTREPGGVVVDGAAGRRLLAAGELAAIAAGIATLVPPRTRQVLVSAGPLADPLARALLAWATTTGAAVVLEPFPDQLASTALWARPTVVAGTRHELESLLAAVGRDDRRWRGRLARHLHRPVVAGRRLALVVVRGADQLTVADEEWRRYGVSVTTERELLGPWCVV